jgi:hypothetical protein
MHFYVEDIRFFKKLAPKYRLNIFEFPLMPHFYVGLWEFFL